MKGAHPASSQVKSTRTLQPLRGNGLALPERHDTCITVGCILSSWPLILAAGNASMSVNRTPRWMHRHWKHSRAGKCLG
eukprot:4656052-Amphidinium_carterae.1